MSSSESQVLKNIKYGISVASDAALKWLLQIGGNINGALRRENGFLTSFSPCHKMGGSPFKMYRKCNPERGSYFLYLYFVFCICIIFVLECIGSAILRERFLFHLKRAEFVFSASCQIIWISGTTQSPPIE